MTDWKTDTTNALADFCKVAQHRRHTCSGSNRSTADGVALKGREGV